MANKKDPLSIKDALEMVKEQGYVVEKNQSQESSDDLGIGKIQIYDKPHITATQTGLGRWYHVKGDHNKKNWRPSMTTCLSAVDKGPGFNAWLMNEGHHAYPVRDAKGQKGTHVHHWIEQLVYGIEVHLDDIYEKIQKDSDQSWRTLWRRPQLFAIDIARNLESFMAFWEEKEPEPIACEYVIYDPELPFAGRLDFVCKMKKAKNSKKKSICLVDFKTGVKSWTQTLQNSGYKMGWDRDNPDLKIDEMACLYVKDSYRSTPTYDLSWQKYSPKETINVVRTWYAMNANKDGVVIPRQPINTRKSFNLYNKQKGAE
tara:strand:- start:7525 stop:8469 length:945 start_codon:yes stop_codon:yes gene_type:complete